MCPQCKLNPIKFTAANNVDPINMFVELQDLTYVKQILIGKLQPVTAVYREKSTGH